MYLGNVLDVNNVFELVRFLFGYVGKRLFCLMYFDYFFFFYKMWNLLNNISLVFEKFVYIGIYVVIQKIFNKYVLVKGNNVSKENNY